MTAANKAWGRGPQLPVNLNSCTHAAQAAEEAANAANNCGSLPVSSDSAGSTDPSHPPEGSPPVSDPKSGIQAGATILGQQAENSSLACAKRIGRYAAMKAACIVTCDNAKSSSSSASNPPNPNNFNIMLGDARSADEAESKCQALSVEVANRQKKGLDEANREAGNTRDTSTANPSGSSSGSGSGGNPMAGLGQLASALGQMMQPQSQTDPQTDTTQADCSSNSMLAGCTTNPASNSWNTASAGTAGYQSNTDSSAQNFNTGDPGSNLQPASTTNPYNNQVNPGMANPIPPGGGGFMASSGPGAQVGSQGSGGGYYGASNRADILHGEHGGGGGYTQTLAGMDTKSGGSGGFSGYGNGPNNAIDLKQFLPGGAKYAGARAPAGLAPASAQINSPQVNVWNRISERIRARCAEGRLRDCVP